MALRHARDWGATDPRWFYGLDPQARAWVVAEWNLRQDSDAQAAYRRAMAAWRARGGPRTRAPAPTPPVPRRVSRRPQRPANALAALAKAGMKVNTTPDAAAFWLGGGLVSVS